MKIGRQYLAKIMKNISLWCEFRVKVLIFCYHGNKGLSGINFSGTVKVHNINNPLFGAIL